MLTDDALEIFSTYISSCQSLRNFAGVCARCVGPDSRLIGTPFNWQQKLSNELNIRHIEKIRGEMFQCTKTKLIAEYFFGMKPGYTNGWAWSRIARNYQYLYTSKIVRIYDTVNPGSTSNLKRLIYLEAQFEQSSYYLAGNVDYLVSDKIFCARMLVQWARIGLHLNKTYTELLNVLPRRVCWLFRFVFAVAVIKAKSDRLKGAI